MPVSHLSEQEERQICQNGYFIFTCINLNVSSFYLPIFCISPMYSVNTRYGKYSFIYLAPRIEILWNSSSLIWYFSCLVIFVFFSTFTLICLLLVFFLGMYGWEIWLYQCQKQQKIHHKIVVTPKLVNVCTECSYMGSVPQIKNT